MLSDEVDLGAFNLAHVESSLQLQVTSQMRFSHIEDHTQFQAELTREDLDTNRHGCPWFAWHHVLRVTIEVSILTDEATESEGIIEAYVKALKSAKVWSEATMVLDSIEVSEANDVYSISLLLKNCQINAVPKTDRATHRLGKDIALHDTRPPHGIQALYLREVNVSMAISKQHGQKRKRSIHETHHLRQRHQPTTCINKSREESPQVHSVHQDDLAHASGHPSFASSFQRLPLSGIQDNQYLTEQVAQTHVCSLLDLSVEDSPDDSDETQTGAIGLHFGGKRNVRPILLLLDAGLRRVITSSAKLRGGISMTQSESFKSLCEIAPSIWRPSYLEMVSTRALLLPTISHVLLDDSIALTEGPRRSKLVELTRRADTIGLPQVQYLKCRLWQMIQSYGVRMRKGTASTPLFDYDQPFTTPQLPLICGHGNKLERALDTAEHLPSHSRNTSTDSDMEDMFWEGPEEHSYAITPVEQYDSGLLSENEEYWSSQSLCTAEPDSGDLDLLSIASSLDSSEIVNDEVLSSSEQDYFPVSSDVPVRSQDHEWDLDMCRQSSESNEILFG